MAPQWLTEAELRARWGSLVDELGDRNSDGAAASADVVAAIEIAESRVSSDLLVQYQPNDLPTTTATASTALKRVVGGLTIWFLAERIPIKSQAIYDARSMAKEELAALKSGNMSLLITGNPTSDLGGAQVLSTSGADVLRTDGAPARGVFTTETLADF